MKEFRSRDRITIWRRDHWLVEMKIFTFPLCAFLLVFIHVQQTFGDTLTALKPYLKMTKPKGAGPFPAILMMSGCSGFGVATMNSRFRKLQFQFTALGFLVVRIDSLKARGQRTCGTGVITREDQVTDVATVAAFFRNFPLVKNDALDMIGWSWGGGGTLAAAMRPNIVDAAIAYFPSCIDVPETAVQVPTLVLFGEADNIVPIKDCKAIFAASKRLTLRSYPGVHHRFDNPRLDPPVQTQFGTLAYNEAAAKAAWEELLKFLVR